MKDDWENWQVEFDDGTTKYINELTEEEAKSQLYKEMVTIEALLQKFQDMREIFIDSKWLCD